MIVESIVQRCFPQVNDDDDVFFPYRTLFNLVTHSESMMIFECFPCFPQGQSIARGLFQLSRRDQKFLPFSLMLRDETQNFSISVSSFETRRRIFLIISCFDTRARF